MSRSVVTTASLVTALMLGFGAGSVEAAPCDRLNADQKKLVQKLFRTTHPYACCDETLDRCLKQKKVCKVVKRLRDDICRRAAKGQSAKEIKQALDRRARSMTPMGKPAAHDLSHAHAAGQATAPVTVVAYACARCPFCSKVIPQLHQLVTKGPLKGKVKLYFRPFPIRGHEGAAEGGLAMMAAAEQDKLWPYVLELYENYDAFSIKKLDDWAAEVGLDREVFRKAMKDKAIRKRLVESKKEGLRNGVSATPTLFINGYQYHGDMNRTVLIDILGEAYDRQAGKQYCGSK
jgi:protein-disulfide isomerase